MEPTRHSSECAAKIIRLENWPRLLSDFIESRRHLPFAWGTNDCCLFASDAVLAITGHDPAEGIRGTYITALGAARLLEERGGVDGIAAAQCAAAGWDSCDVRFAKRGDVVACDMTAEGRPALGVCLGSLSAFSGETGIDFYPTLQCRTAWKIGV